MGSGSTPWRRCQGRRRGSRRWMSTFGEGRTRPRSTLIRDNCRICAGEATEGTGMYAVVGAGGHQSGGGKGIGGSGGGSGRGRGGGVTEGTKMKTPGPDHHKRIQVVKLNS